jgi:ketosteroid isomerase-like protein
MERSGEIRNVIYRLCKSIASGDVPEIRRLFARDEGLLVVGTDAAHGLASYDTVMPMYEAYSRESKDKVRFEVDEIPAFAEGSVGWAAARVQRRWSSGAVEHLRHTTVLHREGIEWKIVQHHVSRGAPGAPALRAHGGSHPARVPSPQPTG